VARERRAKLTRVAYRRIEQAQREAYLQIERSSLELQTRLLADGLESAEAKGFLESMPTPEQLIQHVTVEEIQSPRDSALAIAEERIHARPV
jgi:hypothetical protein